MSRSTRAACSDFEDAHDGSVDVLAGAVVQYRLDVRPWRLADFGPTCWYQQTSPASHFTQGLTCSRLTESGRITLADHLLIRTDAAPAPSTS